MKKAKDIAVNIIMVCLIAIIIISGWYIFKTLKRYYNARIQYNKTTELANTDPNAFTGELDWDALKQENPDVRAWIFQKGTIINYPVVRGKDNSFYLHRMFNGKYNVSGTLFMDANAPDNFEGFNTVIYGHHMRDGSMFRSLREYTQQSYFDEHKRFELITPDAKYHLDIIGFEEVKADSEAYIYQFRDDTDRQKFLDFTASNNKLGGTAEATVRDRIVTLSTCAYDFENARYVVVTKMVPWTKEELREAKRQQEAIDGEGRGRREEGKKITFWDYVRKGFTIVKEAL